VKTVIDAVNEFNSEWPIALIDYPDWRYCTKSELPCHRPLTFCNVQVCTYEEFNRCVYETRQPKPIYTQAMCDAGELPLVGMECMVIGDKEIDDDYHKCIIVANTEPVKGMPVAVFMIIDYAGKPYYYSHCSYQNFKPLDTRTNKQKLADSINKHLELEYNNHTGGVVSLISELILDGKLSGVTFTENDDAK
jgi:hypothetical protein